MSSVFGKLYNAEMSKYNVNVNIESIQPQLNDWFATELITQCNDIILLTKSNKHREVRIILSKIEANITKRFGFNIKIIEDDAQALPLTYPIMLKPNHIFLEAMGEDYWMDHVLDELQDNGVSVNNTVENMNRIRWNDDPTDEEQSEADTDYLTLYRQYVSNMKIGLSKSGIGGITIDLEKGYANGVDSNIYGTILLNIPVMLDRLKDITAEELAAILLHEIGHNFVSIENTKANIDNNLTLVTTLKDVCAMNGKPLKRGLIRAYESITGNIVPNASKVSDRDIALSLIERTARRNNLSTTKSHQINFESQSDLFVSRFGLGGALASAIVKWGNYTGTNTYAILNGAGAMLTMVSIMGIVLLAGLLVQALIVIAMEVKMIIGSFMSVIAMVIGLNFISTDVKPTYEVYDKFRTRLQKIKNDSIRIIRTAKLDAKVKAFVIADIEKVSKFIDKSPRPTEGVFSWLWRKLSRGAQTLFDMKRTEELWEQLQENELYVASGKLNAVIQGQTGVLK